MRAALPEPIDYVLVQADLTLVAPGPLEPDLQDRIELVADVESAGAARCTGSATPACAALSMWD